MKEVVEINKIIEVPDNYQECSVCGRWVDPSGDQFSSREDGQPTRTNCKGCYNLPDYAFNGLSEATKANKKSQKYNKLKDELAEKKDYREYSITVEKYIEMLRALPAGSMIVHKWPCYERGTRESYVETPEAPELDRIYDDIKYFHI